MIYSKIIETPNSANLLHFVRVKCSNATFRSLTFLFDIVRSTTLFKLWNCG